MAVAIWGLNPSNLPLLANQWRIEPSRLAVVVSILGQSAHWLIGQRQRRCCTHSSRSAAFIARRRYSQICDWPLGVSVRSAAVPRPPSLFAQSLDAAAVAAVLCLMSTAAAALTTDAICRSDLNVMEMKPEPALVCVHRYGGFSKYESDNDDGK